MTKPDAAPVDIAIIAVLAATVLGPLYWVFGRNGQWSDFAITAAFLLGTAIAIALVIGGMVWIALRLFSPNK